MKCNHDWNPLTPIWMWKLRTYLCTKCRAYKKEDFRTREIKYHSRLWAGKPYLTKKMKEEQHV